MQFVRRSSTLKSIEIEAEDGTTLFLRKDEMGFIRFSATGYDGFGKSIVSVHGRLTTEDAEEFGNAFAEVIFGVG